MSDKPNLDRQPLSLPSGGGAIKGIGETFAANPFSGTATFTVPLALSPGRNGFGPSLSLSYGTAQGNGPFGFGWELAVPTVSRRTERGMPRYDDRDVFAVSGAEDLVPCLTPQTGASGAVDWTPLVPVVTATHTIQRYRPRTEGLFARIERWVERATGEEHWRSTTADGVTSVYGGDRTARLADPADERRVAAWLLQESFDGYGNHVLYEYARDDPALYEDSPIGLGRVDPFEANRRATQLYLRRIYYGNLRDPLVDDAGVPVAYADGTLVGAARRGRRYAFEVVFDYGDWAGSTGDPYSPAQDNVEQELFGTDQATALGSTEVPIREDRFSSFRAGFEVRTLRRCRRVLMFHHFAELGGPTLVRSTDLTYREADDTGLSFLVAAHVTGHRRTQSRTYATASMPPVTFEYTEFRPGAQRYRSVDVAGGQLPSAALGDPDIALVDLFSEGLPGILEGARGTFRYWTNSGGGCFRSPRALEGVPTSLALSTTGVGFGDIAGDGRTDLLVHGGALPGFFETSSEGPWRTFRPYATFPSFSLDDPNVRLVDLTGNGSSDALLTGPDGFVWFECLGEDGFGPPVQITGRTGSDVMPNVFFGDPQGRVRLADMTGDGLTDIVFVHDGSVEYWPNLGYGRFGGRVTTQNAPRFGPDFDPRRLFLADLDGTGCADVVYVERDRVRFWLNRSGNGWSAPQTIAGTPLVTDATSLHFADVFGTGTATLMWSYAFTGQPESHYKALDFCGGTKPYLLAEMSNHLGMETKVRYGPSTRHYLDDQADGTPWMSGLPVPVHVVEETEVIDHVSQSRHVTTYRYHHGYFDGRDREFRGFARVDRVDGTTFDAGDGFTTTVPIETRTWYHTGLYVDEESGDGLGPLDHLSLAQRLRREFYAGDPAALVLPEHMVDDVDDPHEAYRSLRGLVLRTEVFARDGSTRENRPYEVSDSRYQVELVQPRHRDSPGVFLPKPIEAVSSRYERNLDDPRTTHQLMLEVDSFGNTLRSLTVAYGRRRADPALPTPGDQQRQTTTIVTYDQTEYTNPVDDGASYRTPLVSESRTYELAGFVPVDGPYFSHAEWTAAGFTRLDGAPEIGYEVAPSPGTGQKRLIEHVRTQYRSDDLSQLLPRGQLESLALSGESYELAFTPSLVTAVFGSRVDDALLAGDGGYVHNEGDANWWVPSGRVFFSPGDGDDPNTELTEARRHFFAPMRIVDPFGAVDRRTSDRYDLLAVEMRDPVGNVTSARNDYRVLQPVQIVDPNGNRAEVAFDTLGLVVGTAVRGKPGESVGDSLASWPVDLTPQQRSAFLADPVGTAPALLGDATTRIVHDLHRFDDAGQPPFAAVIARETHASAPPSPGGTKIQITISYSDGLGREVQKKVRAESSAGGSARWIGTGWTVFDDKGHPVRKFEPFFDTTPAFRSGEVVGVSATLLYDPMERVVATLRPDHAWEKVAFDAWRQEQWDANDTVSIADPRSDADVGAAFERLSPGDYLPTWFEARQSGQLGSEAEDAARQAAVHAETPSIAFLDSLGRTFLTIEKNRWEEDGTVVEDLIANRVIEDVEGNYRLVYDGKDREVIRIDYDLLGRPIHQSSMDAGERWMITNASDSPMAAWDDRGHRFRTVYDTLQRPVRNLVLDGTGTERVVSASTYGETVAAPESRNLRGKVVAMFDASGVTSTDEYDFKGNLVASSRQYVADYRQAPDWSASPLLESEIFVTRTSYDALNRAVAIETPHTPSTPPSELRPEYNDGGLLERVEVTLTGALSPTPIIDAIEYNAKGQRTRCAYTNGVVTDYTYGADDLRLTSVHTRRMADGAVLQSLSYTYDPVGNVIHKRDDAQRTIFFANAVVEPHTRFVYDSIYRLVAATGREHAGGQSRPWDERFRTGLAHPHDGQAMRRYTERYTYDRAANLERVEHQAGSGSWTAAFSYNAPSHLDASALSDRLTSWQVGTDPPEAFSYDAHGNLLAMAHLPQIDWDDRDRLSHVDLRGGGEAFYAYDVAGLRTRKVVERNGGAVIEERLYFGAFELFRRRNATGAVTFSRESLHVMDDRLRVALIETVTADSSGGPLVGQPVARVQLGDHLGSATLELDEQGRVITFEEYTPYGATSYQAVGPNVEAPKRYRYIGKERDEETGFACHGVRYYAPWLGRFTSADPIGVARGLNTFAYCGGNPVGRLDADGADWDWLWPGNWCNPTDDDCDVVVDDIVVGAGKAVYQTGEDTVTRTIDLWSMYSPPALLGHATGWYDLSTCLSPECKKYNPNKSVSQNIKGNLYDNTVGGAVELGKRVAEGDREALGALGVAVVMSRGKGGAKGPPPTVKIPVPKLELRATASGAAVPVVALGEVAIARPSLTGFGGPLLSSSVSGSALANAGSGGGSGGGSGKPSVTRVEEGVGKEKTRVKRPTITARPKGGRRSKWDEAAMSEPGMTARQAFPRSPLHHVIPKELLKTPAIKKLLEKRGIDIDEYTVKLSEGEHSAIHTAGFNKLWKDFFEKNPKASRSSILHFVGAMRDWAKISPDLAFERYKR